jgi:hypothetical protein
VTVALTVLVVASLLVVAGLSFATALGRPLLRASTLAAWTAEALLVVAAVVDLARVAGGRRPSELAVHLGYVVVSVVLIPMLVRPLEEGAGDDDVRGRQLVLSLASVAVIVVALRQRATA